MVNELSQYDVGIAFKLLLSLMWSILQYFHLFESICKAWYIEHEINIFKNILLFHDLGYYHNMMWLLFSF